MNGTNFWLAAEHIESVESTPDTIVTLLTGRKIIVLDSADNVIEKIVEYRAKIFGVLQAVENRGKESRHVENKND